MIDFNFNKSVLRTKDYFFSKEKFELFKDDTTGILKTVPQPKELSKYYESEDYYSHGNNKESFFSKIYNVVKRRNIQTKTRLITNVINEHFGSFTNVKVCDVGAGSGELVQSLIDNNISACGVEPSKKARDFAKQNFSLELQPDTSIYEENYFDVITMYHVLEHVPNLSQQILELVRLLKPDGILILALPNYQCLDARVFKEYWAAYDVPRHTFHFSKHSVEILFKSKFRLVNTIPMWWDSFYVSILSARYKKWPIPFISGTLVGFISNLSYLITKQASSHQFILKKFK